MLITIFGGSSKLQFTSLGGTLIFQQPLQKKRHKPSFQRIVWAQAIEVFVTWAQTVVVVRLLGVVGLVAGGVLALDAAQVVA